jgi:hypothetical protein
VPPESGTLTVTVEQVTAGSLRVRLEGFATLEQPGGRDTTLSYQPALLGHMTYDRRQDEVTECEIVAFGEISGRLPGRETIYSEAPRLLGVAFELIPDPSGAETLRPTGARLYASPDRALRRYHRYLDPLSR